MPPSVEWSLAIARPSPLVIVEFVRQKIVRYREHFSRELSERWNR